MPRGKIYLEKLTQKAEAKLLDHASSLRAGSHLDQKNRSPLESQVKPVIVSNEKRSLKDVGMYFL